MSVDISHGLEVLEHEFSATYRASEEVCPSFLLACDGRHSKVRDLVDLVTIDAGGLHSWVILDAKVESNSLDIWRRANIH